MNSMAAHTNAVQLLQIPVSSPPAEIAAAILAPAQYPGDTDVKIRHFGRNKRKLELLLNFNFTSVGAPIPERGTVFLLHGYSLYKETMFPWALALAKSGYRCVLVDLRGHGKSTGDTISFGKFESEDMVQLLDYMTAQGLCKTPVAALGISLGADVALHWMNRDSRVRTVIAIAPYDDTVVASERLADALDLPVTRRSLRGGLQLAGERLSLDWADWTGSAAARNLRAPALFIAGGKDEISRPEEVETLQQLAPSGSKYILVPEANHDVIGVWLHELVPQVQSWLEAQLAAPVKSASVGGN